MADNSAVIEKITKLKLNAEKLQTRRADLMAEKKQLEIKYQELKEEVQDQFGTSDPEEIQTQLDTLLQEAEDILNKLENKGS